MLHDNMNIYLFMVHAQQVEETSFVSCSSNSRLDIQDKPKIKKRVSNQVRSMFANSSDDRVSNPKSKKIRGTSSPTKATCGKCGKKHYGLKGMNNCFWLW